MSFPADLTPGGPDDLYLLCEELLDAAAQAVAITRGGMISRIYVSAGLPPFDCVQGGQLTVHAGGPAIADTLPLQPPLQPAHRIQMGSQLNLVQMTITCIRCAAVPQGQSAVMPPPIIMAEVAAITLADLWAIWNYISTKKREDLLFPPKVREVYLDPAFPVSTSGGAAGWQIPIRVQLNGFVFGT